MKRSIIAAVLTLTMVFTLLPGQVLAESQSPAASEPISASVEPSAKPETDAQTQSDKPLAEERTNNPAGSGKQVQPKGQTVQEPGEQTEPTQETGEVPLQPMETTVSDLIQEKSVSVKSKMKDTISVTPAYGRSVQLQRYNPSEKQWETKAVFQTGTQKTERVTIEYPDSLWNKSKYTIWRIHLPKTAEGSAYTSGQIRIITKNRSSVKLSCKSAVVINAKSGVVLYSKNMNSRRPQASMTKIMTAILAIQKNSLKRKVKISKKAAKTPYSDLKKGDKLYVRQLLYMAMLESDNGAATALAQVTGGSVAGFTKMMNQKAAALGCTNTRFVNAHGLDKKNHYSSAYDVALVARYAMQNKTFRKFVGKKKYTFKTLKKKKRYKLKNTNQLLGKVKGLSGVKTGTTDNAGCCFAGYYKYKGKGYITVVMGDKKDAQRWKDTKNLVKYIKKYGW
ncbi:serine hydrolase [Anaerovorax odorimutans]|uniref:Serine hydrolase n=1 Tax=Anaerovorax odorimutans TaxID=109327 RepID=A0ABT1RR31_9FIRM|nr:serine hydrolase [Anaerovorax odorimutans]MCQ4637628.1 serine hydrolase [Anaerovorax odorimutans]